MLETHEDTEIFQKFKKRFYGTKIHQGMLMGDNGAVGLILDSKANILESFKQTDRTFTAKVNPRARAKFKPYGRNILIGNEFYNGRLALRCRLMVPYRSVVETIGRLGLDRTRRCP